MCDIYRAERKAFRLRERQRIQRLIDGDTHDGSSASTDIEPRPTVTEDVMKPLRLPRETSEALRLLNPNMGLGRGINFQEVEETTPGGVFFAEDSNVGFGQGASVSDELPVPIGIGRGRPQE
jgi:hypothetical protein